MRLPKVPDPRYLAYRAGAMVARALPAKAVPGATDLAARLAQRAMGSRRLIVERNLRRALGQDLSGPELDRAVDQAFTTYSRYWMESFRLPGTSADDLAKDFVAEGFEHIEDAIAAGHGAVVVVPHLGGWEWAAFWMAAVKGMPITAVVEPVEPPELADWFADLRHQFGIEVVPLGPAAGAVCAGALRANQVLVLVCDRDIGGGGIPVEFFGEATTLPGGPATLALRAGAPILPCAIYFDGDGHRGVVRPPLDVHREGSLRADVTRITQDIAHALEALIRAAPEQWHVMQPNWPSDHEALARAGLSAADPPPS